MIELSLSVRWVAKVFIFVITIYWLSSIIEQEEDYDEHSAGCALAFLIVFSVILCITLWFLP